ncbi:MAG: thioredoxin family protein [Bacteroidia bacterium]|nr:thioredoxin family protein [Bacteroidia bacterium]
MKAIFHSIILITLFFSAQAQMQDTSVITLKEYNKRVADKEKLVLVYFSADWCSVCQRMRPAIEEISKQNMLKLNVLKINTDRDKELKDEFEIDALPVLMIYKNGCREWLNIGIISDKELKYIVEHFLKAK